MSEKEKIAKQMKEIVEQFMSESQLKAHMLVAIEQHMKESDLLFGRLAYLHYDLFSAQGDHSTYIAAAVELIVLAGDLLDDVVDQDRFEDTAIPLHIAIGFLLLGQQAIANVPIPSNKKLKALSYVTSCLLQSVHGQQTDVVCDVQTEADYVKMVEKKSGSLVAMACVIGALLAGKEDIATLETYARYIGIAAQIDNDLDALYNWDKKADIQAKKKSLPILYMLESKNDNLWKQYFNNDIDYDRMYVQKEKALQQMEQEGAFYYAKVMSQIYKEKALQEIEKLDVDDAYKSALKTFI
ncbi:polyprenyl synthetase family protein [Anoxybacillus flavithermus]|uniref:polyprenyl synthetase family protein n=1 Tax=Anoxybacillus flavithermus TaxID=33934 RepID=UPI0018673A07|nr:polyprenyl synthetase family protein [Anoxybacillus flavithermus]MBE2939249.1 polyprenyl synthetase [Anoxybacillus flavithermus]MBE2941780.1 polyprenyl synthetase [Anoxybacillus flavithermus]MBE2950017.1 polyprenyl synthetase [Anoxybacillus flavithermus]MBE2952773.1 polyprenyl synthetase [Anoxybacillus flavithermus]MBE2958132.1 polyprenyl synthetase [Anoxybacillus flavithermus]